jgi:hypothetical protein
MIKRNYCTLFDSNYALKGIAMLRSLAEHSVDLQVYVLCMDDLTESLLAGLRLPYVTCIKLVEVETKEILTAKNDRSVAEYCWTLSSCIPWHVMHRHPEIDFITYIDADLLFYSSVEPIYAEIADASVAIIEHRFTPRFRHLEVNGRFCVEWVSFRRDQEGLECLRRWREQCIEWCYYKLEDTRMGDQKYLDEWPRLYRGVHIIQHLGAGVAPWNFDQYAIVADEQSTTTINGSPLIFYHFHQFQLHDDGSFFRLSSAYTELHREPELVYSAYEAALKESLKLARAVQPGFAGGLKRGSKRARQWSLATLWGRLRNACGSLLRGGI